MPKFRKKPVVIEAVQFQASKTATAQVDPAYRVTISTREVFGDRDVFADERGCFLLIQTAEGVMRADDGDWIITGIKGEQYPCKPDVFESTYELVDENQ